MKLATRARLATAPLALTLLLACISPAAALADGNQKIDLVLPSQSELDSRIAKVSKDMTYGQTDSSGKPTGEGSIFEKAVAGVTGGLANGMFGSLLITPRLRDTNFGPISVDPVERPEQLGISFLPARLWGAMWLVGFVFTLLIFGVDLLVRAIRHASQALSAPGDNVDILADLVRFVLAAFGALLSYPILDLISHLMNILCGTVLAVGQSVGLSGGNPDLMQGVVALGAMVSNAAVAVVLAGVLGPLALFLAGLQLLMELALWLSVFARWAMFMVAIIMAPFGIFCWLRGWRDMAGEWLTQYRQILLAALTSAVVVAIIQKLWQSMADDFTHPIVGDVMIAGKFVEYLALLGVLAATNLHFVYATFGKVGALVQTGVATASSVLAAHAAGSVMTRYAGAAMQPLQDGARALTSDIPGGEQGRAQIGDHLRSTASNFRERLQSLNLGEAGMEMADALAGAPGGLGSLGAAMRSQLGPNAQQQEAARQNADASRQADQAHQQGSAAVRREVKGMAQGSGGLSGAQADVVASNVAEDMSSRYGGQAAASHARDLSDLSQAWAASTMPGNTSQEAQNASVRDELGKVAWSQRFREMAGVQPGHEYEQAIIGAADSVAGVASSQAQAFEVAAGLRRQELSRERGRAPVGIENWAATRRFAGDGYIGLTSDDRNRLAAVNAELVDRQFAALGGERMIDGEPQRETMRQAQTVAASMMERHLENAQTRGLEGSDAVRDALFNMESDLADNPAAGNS